MELAEIQAAIAANPTLKTGLVGALRDDVLTVVKGEGFAVRNKDEETEFLTNYEKNIIPGKVAAEIGSKVGEVHTRYDNDLFELLGKKKGPNEKTYEFMKKEVAALKKLAEGKGGSDDVTNQKLAAAEAQLEKYKDYVPKEDVDKLRSGYTARVVKGNINTALSGKVIALPAHLTDDTAKNEYANGIKAMVANGILEKYEPREDNDGNIVYYEGDKRDKLAIDPKTNKPLTEADLIAKHFAHFFAPAPKIKTGGGGGNDGGGEGDTTEAECTTKEQVMAHLEKKGMTRGAKDFNKEYSRIVKEQAITK